MAKTYRLKVTLTGVKPPIWRRIELGPATKLPIVSRVILAAMGWTDMHLHGFRAMDGSTYMVPDPDFPNDDHDERTASLSRLVTEIKDRFTFDYDFGDGWEHSVVLEEIIEADEKSFPRCIAGRRNCPPEDCGGPYGYAELLEALADLKHRRHREILAWLPDDFDPEYFDVHETNTYIRSLFNETKK